VVDLGTGQKKLVRKLKKNGGGKKIPIMKFYWREGTQVRQRNAVF